MVMVHFPVATSQILTCLSALALASTFLFMGKDNIEYKPSTEATSSTKL